MLFNEKKIYIENSQYKRSFPQRISNSKITKKLKILKTNKKNPSRKNEIIPQFLLCNPFLHRLR
jgi:hypothetical protein